MKRELAGITIITILAILGRLMEDTRKIGLAPQGAGKRLANIQGMYECCNVHLTLSLAMFGFVWSTSADLSMAAIIFVLILSGIASKAVMSKHKPERLSLKDFDALYGFFIPNACALAAMIFVLASVAFGEAKTPHLNDNGNQPPAPHAAQTP
jgi:hypothetical protein